MGWCEPNRVDYVLGLTKYKRLKAETFKEQEEATPAFHATGQSARVSKELSYQTRQSWSQARRVVAKAEHPEKGANPRVAVTSLGPEPWQTRLFMKTSTLPGAGWKAGSRNN
jgi:Transposase DDE domain group 1